MLQLKTALNKSSRLLSKAIICIALATTCGLAVADDTPLYQGANSPTLDASSTPNVASAPVIIPPAPAINAKAYVLLDVYSGKIIASKNMDVKRAPASLTKMMTLYVASNAIKIGQINLNDKVHISKKAWAMGGSKMFVKEGAMVTVHELIQGIIVDSGNDACVALAQYIAGNEKTFAHMMNQTAAALGMKNSHFTDSTGLPHPDHYSSAHDLAILARALITNFPEDYKWYKQKWFTHSGIRQSNRNLLLWRDKSVDGLKTGHTKAAGYCLVASALRGNMRLLSVVMGTPSMRARSNTSQALLNYGFRFYRNRKLYSSRQAITKSRVWFGNKKYVAIGPIHDVYTTTAINQNKKLQVKLQLQRLKAPIDKNQLCGTALVYSGKNLLVRIPLISLEADTTTGVLGRISDHLAMWIHHLWNRSA